MEVWVAGGPCPFGKSARDYVFTEKKELWVNRPPRLRGRELLQVLARECGIKL